jgi:uncharacterized oxidoreductase
LRKAWKAHEIQEAMKLTNNTLLITGGGTGIGLAMASAFLERGNQVLICGRRTEKLKDARRALPGLQTYRCDVSDAGDQQRLLDSIRADGYQVNVLVNNAAIMRKYDLTDAQTLDAGTVMMDLKTNLAAPIEMVNLFLEGLKELPEATIINISSPGGLVPVAKVPIYCASKAALHSYTLSLRHQLRGRVRVIEVYPPSVDTPMMEGVGLRKVSVEQFSKALMPRLAKGEEEIWLGESRYLPLMHRLAPGRAFQIVNRATKIS